MGQRRKNEGSTRVVVVAEDIQTQTRSRGRQRQRGQWAEDIPGQWRRWWQLEMQAGEGLEISAHGGRGDGMTEI